MSGRGRGGGGGRGRGRGGAAGGRGRGRSSGSSGRGSKGRTTGAGILRETGKRSGVVVEVKSARSDDSIRDADGLLDEDRLFASARAPTEPIRRTSSSSSESPPSSRALPGKPGRSIRFSIDDNNKARGSGDGGSFRGGASPASSQRRPQKQSATATQVPPPSVLRRRLLPFAANRGSSTTSTPSSVSPGALSRASTAPPDPFYDSDDTHEDDEPDNTEEDEEEVTADDPVDEGEDEPSPADVAATVAYAQRKNRGSTEGDAPSRPVEHREDSMDRGDEGDDASPSDLEHQDDTHDVGVDAEGHGDNDAPQQEEYNEEVDHDDLAPNPPSPDDYDHVLGRGDSPDPELEADDTPEPEAVVAGADDRGHEREDDKEEEVDFPPAEDGYDNDDDEGDDQEGPGYHMAGDPGSGEEDENKDPHLGEPRPAAAAASSAARGKRPDAMASSDDSSEGDNDNNRHAASKQVTKRGAEKLRAQETDDRSVSSSEDDAPSGRSTKKRSHKPSMDSSSEDEREAQTKKKNKDRTTQKQKKRKQNDSSRSDEIDAADRPRKKRNPKAKIAPKPIFTPKGIALPRTYNTVPVSDLKETPDATLRRSRRARIKPLEYWRNETVLYGPDDEFDDPKYDSLRNMPVPKGVRFADQTPYKPRAPPKGSKKDKGNRQKRNGRGGSLDDEDDDENGNRRHNAPTERPPFDFTKLRKKRGLMKGDEALVWDDTEQHTANLKVVSYQEDLRPRTLPQTHPRRPDESELLGSAAQAFNVSNADSDHYPGYLMGNLVLPPRAIKDPEAVGNCAQTFTVVRSQPKALEVSYGHPDVDEGIVDPAHAQSFFLGAGDMFRVPPGNCYRLENHSRVDDCLLTWTILRTLQEPE